MTGTTELNGTANTAMSSDPYTWGPPEAPLVMPLQQLERRSGQAWNFNPLRLFFGGSTNLT
ncbi:hypothetical protein [Primorskyibacter sedentarius]|uniref:hypothetical protein n=1 Tax=Primorskyibacter sedentarius TaxID=745311 RepID=UPI003EBE47A4